jgi:hypothetical protein
MRFLQSTIEILKAEKEVAFPMVLPCSMTLGFEKAQNDKLINYLPLGFKDCGLDVELNAFTLCIAAVGGRSQLCRHIAPCFFNHSNHYYKSVGDSSWNFLSRTVKRIPVKRSFAENSGT